MKQKKVQFIKTGHASRIQDPIGTAMIGRTPHAFYFAEGIPETFKDLSGSEINVYLEYCRPFWRATESTTGLDITACKANRKEDLLNVLSQMNIKIQLDREYHKTLAAEIKQLKTILEGQS